MEAALASLIEALLDPVVLLVALATTIILISGLPARLIEHWDEHIGL